MDFKEIQELVKLLYFFEIHIFLMEIVLFLNKIAGHPGVGGQIYTAVQIRTVIEKKGKKQKSKVKNAAPK